MLYLIGLGISDEKDITLKGIDACKDSDRIYAELYTLNWGGSLDNLSDIVGKEIKEIPRSGMEEDSDKILEEAKEQTISVLVPGDPLVATTHIHIIEEARKRGIKTKIIHSSSIFSAIAKTGLQLYKFGRTATVVEPTPEYSPDSFYDAAEKNKSAGLHTMMLLNIRMSISEGAKILLDIEEKKKKRIFTPETKVIACSKLGSDNEKIIYSRAEELLSVRMPSPAVIVIPGDLHFSEEEILEIHDKY